MRKEEGGAGFYGGRCELSLSRPIKSLKALSSQGSMDVISAIQICSPALGSLLCCPRPTFTLLLALVVVLLLLLLWDQALWNVGFIGGMGFLGMRSLGSIGFIGSVGQMQSHANTTTGVYWQPSCVMLVCCLCVLMHHHMHHRGDYRYWRALLWRVRSMCGISGRYMVETRTTRTSIRWESTTILTMVDGPRCGWSSW
jgi:hypothetical protein